MLHVDNFLIDRFEGDIAVCVDDHQDTREIPRSSLPFGVRAGDRVLRFPGGPWRLDDEATRKNREALKESIAQLWED
jgi:hypothetical protein